MSGGTQTTTATNEPSSLLKPVLRKVRNEAMDLYNDGVGVNNKSMVVPQSRQTKQALKGMMQDAKFAANNKNGMNAQLSDIIGQGGFNDRQLASLRDMSQQQRQLGNNGLTNAQDAAMQNFRQLANSEYSMDANPGAQGVLDAAIRDASNATNLSASAAGRYGSGTHEGVLASKIGDLSSNFRYNDFNNFLGRQDAANSSMAQLGQVGLQNRQGLSNNIFNASQAGQQNMTNAYQAQQAPNQQMLAVGASNEDLKRRQLDDRARIMQEPWTALSRLNAATQGMGQYGTQTTQAPGPNQFLQTLGGVSTGVGLLGGLGFL